MTTKRSVKNKRLSAQRIELERRAYNSTTHRVIDELTGEAIVKEYLWPPIIISDLTSRTGEPRMCIGRTKTEPLCIDRLADKMIVPGNQKGT